jgi:hypothetical protein
VPPIETPPIPPAPPTCAVPPVLGAGFDSSSPHANAATTPTANKLETNSRIDVKG